MRMPSSSPGLLCRVPAMLCAALLIVSGCTGNRTSNWSYLAQGEYGRGRDRLQQSLQDDRTKRDYLLDRMSLGLLLMADGYVDSAGFVFEDIYDILRTQGINADKTVSAVVINEGVKFWKGEPFEQAMAIWYYGVQQASLGAWDNTRAAAAASLFRLRDFSEEGESTERINTLEIARRALEYERAVAAGQKPPAEDEGDYLDHGYAVRNSNFTLGYLLHAVASQQLGRADEASDFYRAALAYNPALQGTVDELRRADWNTLFVVSFGIGPRKIAYGPDNAMAGFQPVFASSDASVSITIDQQPTRRHPVAHDLNLMARDHMWNNLEDVRIGKSYLGQALMTAGAVTAAYGIDRRNDTATAIGAGLILAGAAARLTAHADTRYCDSLPQRVYLVPATVTDQNTQIMLQVDNQPQSRIVLTGLEPPAGRTAQLRYVRLVSGMPNAIGSGNAPGWATSGRIHYSNDRTGDAPGTAAFPYILGGDDVRLPTDITLGRYRQAGYLRGVMTGELRDLYAAEGITYEREATGGIAPMHVLEGGRTLVTPLPGSAGFARLFGQVHPPYTPRSDLLRRAIQQQLGQPSNDPP